MDSQKEEIILKIRKLLAKTEVNGATAQEAASALAMAQKLMAKHNVFVTEADDTEPIVEEQGSYGTKSVSKFQWLLADSLSDHFACEVVMRGIREYGQKLCFIGEKTKVTLFKDCFEFAYRAYQTCFRDFMNRKEKDVALTLLGEELSREDKTQMRWDYFKGFVQGLTNELVKSESENALVIVKSDELQEHMDKMHIRHTKITTKMIKSASVMEAGYRDGAYAFRNQHSALPQ